jgi:formylglycine-generating enzyme required for sulfatase activity
MLASVLLLGAADVAALPEGQPMGKDGAVMLTVPEGCFEMGTNHIGSDQSQGFPNEGPQHTVCLKAYALDEYEVSIQRYAKFMQDTGHEPPGLWDDDAITAAPDRPVVGVTWQDAHDYCKWAGKRLPTEAEWERAAGGPDQRRYPWGNMAPFPDLANYNRGDWVSFPVTLAPITYGAAGLNVRLGISEHGGRSPLGFYNMAGNAAEWVADWYGRDYYAKSPKDNPAGPPEGERKVFRGGSWIDSPRNLRVTARFSAEPDFQDRILGFRCAMDVTT